MEASKAPPPLSTFNLVAGGKKDRTFVSTLVIVQTHVSEIVVDTDMARKKMSTVATFTVVNFRQIRLLTLKFQLDIYLQNRNAKRT